MTNPTEALTHGSISYVVSSPKRWRAIYCIHLQEKAGASKLTLKASVENTTPHAWGGPGAETKSKLLLQDERGVWASADVAAPANGLVDVDASPAPRVQHLLDKAQVGEALVFDEAVQKSGDFVQRAAIVSLPKEIQDSLLDGVVEVHGEHGAPGAGLWGPPEPRWSSQHETRVFPFRAEPPLRVSFEAASLKRGPASNHVAFTVDVAEVRSTTYRLSPAGAAIPPPPAPIPDAAKETSGEAGPALTDSKKQAPAATKPEASPPEPARRVHVRVLPEVGAGEAPPRSATTLSDHEPTASASVARKKPRSVDLRFLGEAELNELAAATSADPSLAELLVRAAKAAAKVEKLREHAASARRKLQTSEASLGAALAAQGVNFSGAREADAAFARHQAAYGELLRRLGEARGDFEREFLKHRDE